MTTTPSMPLELTRERASMRIAPFVITWHACGARGGNSPSTVRLHVHEVGGEHVEVTADAVSSDGRHQLLDRQWLAARVLVQEELIHLDVAAPAMHVIAGNGAADGSAEGGSLLRTTMTRDLRAIFIRSSLPALAGLAAGRYEPAQLERADR